jgi:hypothetical protein
MTLGAEHFGTGVNAAKLFSSSLTMWTINWLPLANIFNLVIVNHLLGNPLYGRLLALPTNIRLGWKSLPGTNALAYYEKS